jgi:hypothetical protein
VNCERRQIACAVGFLFLTSAAAVAWQVGFFTRFQAAENATAAIFATAKGDRYHLWSVAAPFYTATALILAVAAVYAKRLWSRTRLGASLVIAMAIVSWFAVATCAGILEMIGYQRPFI